MNRIKHFLVLTCLFLCAPGVHARLSGAEADSARVEWRRMDPEQRRAFLSDSEFRYGRPQEGITPLQRLWYWVRALIDELFYFASKTVPGLILSFTLIFALILIVIVRFLNVDVRNLFYPQVAKAGRASQSTAVELENTDFEPAIARAVSGGDFREAIRLTFLFALRKLADTGYIQPAAGKTNDEYLAELGQHPTRLAAQTLRYYFDYTWYGDFQADEKVFRQVNQTFREFNDQLR